jgi:hypothetical protein
LNVSKRQLLDVSACAFLVYAAVWIYELANFASFSMVGSQTSLVFSTIAPIGVSASVTGGNLLLFVKPVQIALSTMAMLGVFYLVRSMKLRLSSSLAVTMISIYLASAYWELLSSVGSLSYESHVVIFSMLAIGAQVGLSNRLKT